MIMNSYCHQASIKSIVNGPTLDYSTKCIIENLIARHWFCVALFFFFLWIMALSVACFICFYIRVFNSMSILIRLESRLASN